MSLRRNQSQLPARSRGVLLLVGLLAIGATACSSPSEEIASTAEDSGVDASEFVESAEPDGLALVDEQQSEEPEAVAVETTTTTTVVEESTATTVETVESGPVFSEDTDTTHVRVSADGDTLNVRTEPNPSSDIVSVLAANTWYVETTGNVADVDGTIWRELNLPSGQQGWAHGGFLQTITPNCTNVTIGSVYEENQWDANFDGDGLVDVVHYIRDTNGDLFLRVEFGNGATSAVAAGSVSNDFPDRIQNVVVAEDINGDGFDEIQTTIYNDADRTRSFTSMNGCSFVQHGKGFNTSVTAGSTIGWNCTDFGTSAVNLWDIIYVPNANGGGTTTADGFSFDPATGFTSTGQTVTLDDQQSQDFFDPLCSNDFD